jgi:hypothetical protein
LFQNATRHIKNRNRCFTSICQTEGKISSLNPANTLAYLCNDFEKSTNSFQFLQFDQIPKYSPNGFFISLGPATPNAPLEPGTKMHIVLRGGTFDPTILVSPSPIPLAIFQTG